MTAVATPPDTGAQPTVPRPRRRLPSSLPGLAGIVAIAALLPLRGIWLVDLLLVGLMFTVPGVLALRALRVPSAAVAGYPIYIPAAALLVMTGAGLASDLIGPHIGIPRPLQGDTTAIATLVLALALWVMGIRSSFAARFPWRSLCEKPGLLAPLALPGVGGCGALLLNNGHGALLARLAVALTAAALLLCLLRASRLSRAHVGMILFGCALAAEWAFSLRSQEVIGFDISAELHIAQHTQALGIWHPVHRNDAYGAMLSLTILPSTLASVTGCSPLLTFKVLYPVLTALLPVTTFLIGDRIMRRSFAAGAAALLIAQSYFFQLMPQLARQEVGLLFFAALAFALFDKRLRPAPRVRLVAALAIGLVVSHYSSTYLAIPAFLVAFVIQAAVSRLRPVPLLSRQLLCASIVLIGGSALWYGAVTHSTSNLTSFTSSVEKRGLDLLPNRQGNLIASYFGGNVVTNVTGPSFEQLAVRDYRSRAAYIHPLAASRQRQFRLRPSTAPAPKVHIPILATMLRLLATVLGQLMLVFGGLGALLIILGRRSSSLGRQIGIVALATVGVLVLIRFSGTAAAAYNQPRALLQSLILLAIPAAWLADRLVTRLRLLGRAVGVGFALAVSLLFAYESGETALLVGGGTSLNLSRSGEDFERQYMTPAELAGATWASRESRRKLLYSDRYGQLRLFASTGAVALTNVTPETLDHHAWLYGTRTNTALGRARGQVENSSAVYQWPAAFLNSYFDTVYANGDSKVYHR